MTNVVILGVNHFDPLGRTITKQYIEGYFREKKTFEYICTEWDEKTAHILIDKREDFKDFVTRNNKIGLNTHTINLIADSLAYEADVFLEDFPRASIVWLDEGKSYKTLEGYFKFRLDVIIQQTMNKPFDVNDIPILSRNLWELSLEEEDIGGDIKKRDRDLFDAILNNIPSNSHDVLVLIGAKHAQVDRTGSTAQLLVQEGYIVESIILSPTPRSVDPTPTTPDV